MKTVRFELGKIIQGSCLEVLPTLPEKSIQMCMTSPPYWALRSYLDKDDPLKGKELGSEPTPEEYVANMVKVFREVRRVLRDDGILVLNLGDSYGSGTSATRKPTKTAKHGYWENENINVRNPFPSKQLIGIPWRTAFALQADGWILRSDVPWVKRGPMPESVTDRPAKALEYVFLFAKSERYFWDMEAVRKPHIREWNPTTNGGSIGCRGSSWMENAQGRKRMGKPAQPNEGGRNFRNADLWFDSVDKPHGLVGIDDELVGLDVTSEPLYQAHFAAYPCALVEPFVKAGTSLKGCCPKCGTPWRRKVERDRKATRPALDSKVQSEKNQRRLESSMNSPKLTLASFTGNRDPQRHVTETKTVGWEPGCKCGKEPVPCKVFDPFAGAGTTLLVAQRQRRKFVGIELSPQYVELATKRLNQRGELGGPKKEAKGFRGFK